MLGMEKEGKKEREIKIKKKKTLLPKSIGWNSAKHIFLPIWFHSFIYM